MSIVHHSQKESLLDYAISTNPDPIQVAPKEGEGKEATITIVVSNGTEDVIICERIDFSFDIGPLAQDLTNVGTGIHITASPSDQWQVTSNGEGLFTATPKKPEDQEITEEGLLFQIDNIHVNEQVGSFDFRVSETASSDSTVKKCRHDIYKIAKFPYGFFVNHFYAKKPQVDFNESVELFWSGSEEAEYSLLYDKKSIRVINHRSWISESLKHDTTFLLRATAQGEGETVSIYLSTTVIVNKPEIVATSLTVEKAASIGGALNVESDSSLHRVHANFANVSSDNQNFPAANFEASNASAVIAKNHSQIQPTILAINTNSGGEYGKNSGIAIYSNSKIATTSGHASFTHLPTSSGFKVFTSPLSPEIEIHFSGDGVLENGQVRIQFETELMELIAHLASYKVFLTPTDECNGLYVAEKSKMGFLVKELSHGNSTASFDWFVIARKKKTMVESELLKIEINGEAEEMLKSLPMIDLLNKND